MWKHSFRSPLRGGSALEPWVLPPPDSALGSYIAERFRAGGLEPPHANVVSFSIPLHHRMLATGRFVTLLPVSILQIVRPMAFAVLRLTANSNFVGCSMGKSFGCRPCNILSTNFALCRNKAGPSAPYDIRPPLSTKPRVVEAAGKRCSSARSAIRLVDKLP